MDSSNECVRDFVGLESHSDWVHPGTRIAPVTHAIEPQHLGEQDLAPVDRTRLEQAHQQLASAVADYSDRFIAASLSVGEPIPVHNASEMAAAQSRVDAAEDELWRLRDVLLGWKRPPWAQRAAAVDEWFSPEDSVYDSVVDD